MDLVSGTPFWVVRDGPSDPYPALTTDASAEIVVIGAGITGALAAYELTLAGADVIVLERDEVASGSSSATSGLLMYDTDASLEDLTRRFGPERASSVYRCGLEAISRIEELCATLGDSGFSRRPSMYLASSEKDAEGLETEFRLRREHGFHVEWFAREKLESQYSFTAPAALRSHGGEIDCYRFARRLLAAAHAHGARIYANSPVTDFKWVGSGGVEVIVAGDRIVRASRAIGATGYELATHLDRPTGNLASTWIFATEPLDSFDGWDDRCLIWETARPYLYIRSTDDGRLLIGGYDEPWAEEHRSRPRYEEKTRTLFERARRMFPRLRLDIAYSWAGTFATTDDGLPFIGAVDECPGMWFALGYGGNGLTFSVIAANILTAMYRGERPPEAELFSFNRPGVRRT